jgi:hypothetical protein
MSELWTVAENWEEDAETWAKYQEECDTQEEDESWEEDDDLEF